MSKYSKRKDGRYYTKVIIGYKDGKPIYKFIYAKTIKELEEKKYSVILNKNKTSLKDITLGEFSKRWIKQYKSDITKGTLKHYTTALNKYILPVYEAKLLSQIKRSDIQNLINENFHSHEICRRIRATFYQILNCAMIEEIIDKNVCFAIKMPKVPKPQKRALTEDEIKAIHNADFTEQERLFIDILYYFGVRKGEALALKGTDFKDGYLNITKSLTTEDNKGIIKEPKTKNSIRKIPIPKQFNIPKGKGYLFLNEKGEFYFEARFKYFWKHIKNKIEKQLGYKTDLSCHLFRHNYCTLCYYNFSMLQTIKLLGHADEKMIMEVYAHLDSQKENLTEKINNMFVDI